MDSVQDNNVLTRHLNQVLFSPVRDKIIDWKMNWQPRLQSLEMTEEKVVISRFRGVEIKKMWSRGKFRGHIVIVIVFVDDSNPP